MYDQSEKIITSSIFAQAMAGRHSHFHAARCARQREHRLARTWDRATNYAISLEYSPLQRFLLELMTP